MNTAILYDYKYYRIKKPAFEPNRHPPELARIGAKSHPINHSLQYPDEQWTEICLNMCQIPRLHIFVNGLLIRRKKNAPDISSDMPATNGLKRRLKQINNL